MLHLIGNDQTAGAKLKVDAIAFNPCCSQIICNNVALHVSHIMRKPVFPFAKTKVQIRCAVTLQLISDFVFLLHR